MGFELLMELPHMGQDEFIWILTPNRRIAIEESPQFVLRRARSDDVG